MQILTPGFLIADAWFLCGSNIALCAWGPHYLHKTEHLGINSQTKSVVMHVLFGCDWFNCENFNMITLVSLLPDHKHHNKQISLSQHWFNIGLTIYGFPFIMVVDYDLNNQVLNIWWISSLKRYSNRIFLWWCCFNMFYPSSLKFSHWSLLGPQVQHVNDVAYKGLQVPTKVQKCI